MSNDYLPMGTWDGDPSAPWNQEEPKPKEVEVTISVTLSKTVTINVDDYEYIKERDESGTYGYYDYSNCDLVKAVEKQITLPQDTKDFKDWNVDEMEVILE